MTDAEYVLRHWNVPSKTPITQPEIKTAGCFLFADFSSFRDTNRYMKKDKTAAVIYATATNPNT